MDKSNTASVKAFPIRQPASGIRQVEISRGVVIGSKRLVVIAGPCSIESEEQFFDTADAVIQCGAAALRGGVFKPRTSPYSFQGLGCEGLGIIKHAKKRYDVPIVSELLDVRYLDDMCRVVDMIQVGSRNMYNYPLLKELGKVNKPVLLKRGFMATLEEFVGAAHYILSNGNNNVVLCERGIRSFDSATRFCLDLSSVPVLKEMTGLPVVVDPSHATGVSRYVEPMAMAAVAAGADGVMVEVHRNPSQALSDGHQSLNFAEFRRLCSRLRGIANAVGRRL
ncbi:MAG: 3-deoxy-7-phosphoheptulonate synthase [Candidatus Dadabacteria bacterium]|nr:MAG: 3-deoxy-7-phosphoheptulonate synthase [Candidatus Dadabacteria bacterium]